MPATVVAPVGDQFGPAYIGVSHIFSISLFSLILRLSSFLHDPIEYDASRAFYDNGFFSKKLMLTLAFWSSLMLAHAFWSSLGFFLSPCGLAEFFKSFFFGSLFAFFVLFCVALRAG